MHNLVPYPSTLPSEIFFHKFFRNSARPFAFSVEEVPADHISLK